MRQERLERAPRVGDAVQQNHRQTRWIALLDVLQRHSTFGEHDGIDAIDGFGVIHWTSFVAVALTTGSARESTRDEPSAMSARAHAFSKRARTACASSLRP